MQQIIETQQANAALATPHSMATSMDGYTGFDLIYSHGKFSFLFDRTFTKSLPNDYESTQLLDPITAMTVRDSKFVISHNTVSSLTRLDDRRSLSTASRSVTVPRLSSADLVAKKVTAINCDGDSITSTPKFGHDGSHTSLQALGSLYPLGGFVESLVDDSDEPLHPLTPAPSISYRVLADVRAGAGPFATEPLEKCMSHDLIQSPIDIRDIIEDLSCARHVEPLMTVPYSYTARNQLVISPPASQLAIPTLHTSTVTHKRRSACLSKVTNSEQECHIPRPQTAVLIDDCSQSSLYQVDGELSSLTPTNVRTALTRIDHHGNNLELLASVANRNRVRGPYDANGVSLSSMKQMNMDELKRIGQLSRVSVSSGPKAKKRMVRQAKEILQNGDKDDLMVVGLSPTYTEVAGTAIQVGSDIAS